MTESVDERVQPIPNPIIAKIKQYFWAVIIIIVIMMLLYTFL